MLAKKSKENLSVVVGFLLLTASIVAAVFFGWPYWYSFYVIGAFVFFGGLNAKLKATSVYSYILKGKWFSFLLIYVAGVLLALFVDIIYGRNIADLWFYPFLKGPSNYLVPLFLYYPFGGLQVYEIFYFFKKVFEKKISSHKTCHLPEKTKNLIMNLLIIFLVVGLIVPVVNFFSNHNAYANEISSIFLVLTIFSADALVFKLKKESILLEAIEGNKSMISTMFCSWLLAAILTEVPNVFAWEWIYHKIPFVSLEICKINILIFIFGWFFLVFVPVRGIDFVRKLFKI